MRNTIESQGFEQLWVARNGYGRVPSPEASRMVIGQSEGRFSVAIAGYSNNAFLPVIDRPDDTTYTIDHEGRPYPVILHHGIAEVDTADTSSYLEQLQTSTGPNDLLADVLAEGKSGLWAIQGPAEYNEYETFAQLMLDGAGRALLSWGELTAEPGRLYDYSDRVASIVVADGPDFTVNTLGNPRRNLGANVIDDRLAEYPLAALLLRELTPDDELALRYSGDRFASSSDLRSSDAPKPLAETEIVYGS